MFFLYKKIRRNSVRFYIIVVFSLIWVLLLVSVGIYANFTDRILIAEIKNTNQNMLELYGEQLNTLCTEINRCLADKIVDSAFLAEDFDADSFSDELARDVLLYDNQFSFYYSNPTTEEYIFQTASNITRKEREGFSSFFYSLDSKESLTDWDLISVDGISCLTRFYYKSGNYVGSWISLSNALKLYTENRFATEGILYFTDQYGNVLAKEEGDFSVDEARNSKKFLLLSVSVLEGQLNLNLCIPYRAVLSRLYMVRIVETFCLIFIIISVPVLLYFLNRIIFKPMENLTAAMEEVQAGDFTISVESAGNAEEFRKTAHTFNNMVSEINHLKVDVYEREIYNQKLELEMLQQQVKPHFYLNCLNIIYNLAEGEEYELIQELCMAQVKYFRYMLKSLFTTVALSEEFDHIQNYLHIQQLRYPDRFQIHLLLQSSIESIRIPPLILHVFAENVVKHASMQGDIQLEITAGIQDNAEIKIEIMDNGPGFPQSLLERLNKGEDISGDSGKHIGISNTIKRLKLFYNGKARILFENRSPHGARITLWIPDNSQDSP